MHELGVLDREAVLRETGSVRAPARHFARDRRQIYRWMAAFGVGKPMQLEKLDEIEIPDES